ncbi:uncharacterized protein E0L32_008096 [Thyridium curvatum]|uniref:Altered inheritance of mitochondria protein 32 n=1 Tax=Thyridium curvatum TaxID=1093900 RepID=A0A507B2U9_9PEZI|nr:uncharacterized protein E0L32_008096 [Thyridium curvatum]TPX10890.1 hypothetical protein E0L32_008096 [Thyridium curvatum]
MSRAPFSKVLRALARNGRAAQRRPYSSRKAAPPFPTVQSCPQPTCECAATPQMPDGLEIDHKGVLNGNITSYYEHVLICTGRTDWPSRIEEENSGDNLAADLKELFGRGGVYSDPYHNVSTLNSSFPSSVPRRSELQTTSVYLLPSFKYVPFLPRVSFDSVEALAKGFLLPEKLHPAHDGLSPIHRDRLTRKAAYQELLWGVRDVRDVMVLVCGHGGRDMRCGVMAPVLEAEFERQLPAAGVEVLHGPVEAETPEGLISGPTADAAARTARVGAISHIGGHKYAGNVIIYLPGDMTTEDGRAHPLAGHGICSVPCNASRATSRCFSNSPNSRFRETKAYATPEGKGTEPPKNSEQASQQFAKRPKRGRNATLFLLSAVAIVGIAGTGFEDQPGIPLLSAQGLLALRTRLLYGDPLNQDRFVPFTIVDREQVSPTAFVITVRPKHARTDDSPTTGFRGGGGALHANEDVVRDAWRHGLWAVEIKQPQLQVARDYTPLPPRRGRADAELRRGELRFLIRRMPRGEVSSYLSALPVGADVELRGPHYGFDLAARMRLNEGERSSGAPARAVFLAGGTGIAPALQAVRAILGPEEGVVQADTETVGGGRPGPVVDVFWANRMREDCVGCGDGLASSAPGPVDGSHAPGEPLPGSIVDQLREMKAQYGDRLDVRCFVDEERSFIGARAVTAALQPQKKTKGGSREAARQEPDCRYHDAKILEWTDTDVLRTDGGEGTTACSCGGKNLALVSGPDGFIQAFAGPKRWANGKELQGQVGGVLGEVRRKYPDLMKDWLVLKL